MKYIGGRMARIFLVSAILLSSNAAYSSGASNNSKGSGYGKSVALVAAGLIVGIALTGVVGLWQFNKMLQGVRK